MEAPHDLLPVSAAEKAAGLGRNVVAHWVRKGQVKTHGRGARRAVLVSLAEVRAAAGERDAYTTRDAMRLLHLEWRRVVELCESGALPFTRRGDTYRIARGPVDRLAIERADARDRFVTIEQAIAETGWPRWVLLRLEGEGTIETRPGARGSRLIARAELETLRAKQEESPALCVECGKPVEIGRQVHKGVCAGKLVRSRTEEARQASRIIRAGELEQFKYDNDLKDTRELAREFDRAPRVIWSAAIRNGCGTLYLLGPGSMVVLFTPTEVERLRRHTSDALARAARDRWDHTRGPNLKDVGLMKLVDTYGGPARKRWKGRFGGGGGAVAGFEKGGRPSSLWRMTAEQTRAVEQEMERLHREGMGPTGISRAVFGGPQHVGRVRNYLVYKNLIHSSSSPQKPRVVLAP